MPHGDSFTLKSVKPLHDLDDAARNCRVIFVSGEDCSPRFYVAPNEVAETIEAHCEGTHYPTSGWLLVEHDGDDRLSVFDNRRVDHREGKSPHGPEVKETKELCKLGIAALVADPDKLARLESLLAELNADSLREINDFYEDETT